MTTELHGALRLAHNRVRMSDTCPQNKSTQKTVAAGKRLTASISITSNSIHIWTSGNLLEQVHFCPDLRCHNSYFIPSGKTYHPSFKRVGRLSFVCSCWNLWDIVCTIYHFSLLLLLIVVQATYHSDMLCQYFYLYILISFFFNLLIFHYFFHSFCFIYLFIYFCIFTLCLRCFEMCAF